MKGQYRLGQIARRLNIGLNSVCDILTSEGFKIDYNPNYRISEEMLDAVVKHLSNNELQRTFLHIKSKTSKFKEENNSNSTKSNPSSRIILSGDALKSLKKSVELMLAEFILRKKAEFTEVQEYKEAFNESYKKVFYGFKKIAKGFKLKIKKTQANITTTFEQIILKLNQYHCFPDEDEFSISFPKNDLLNLKHIPIWIRN